MSAPKRKKEPFEVPASQVLIKKKKEDIFGTSLMRLQNTNTLNSKESRKLMEQATEAGLDFKHPFQHSATQDEPEEGKAYSIIPTQPGHSEGGRGKAKFGVNCIGQPFLFGIGRKRKQKLH